MQVFQFVLTIVIVAACMLSVFFSIRYRRQLDPRSKGLDAASMNVSMGIMLIAIALMQLTLFQMSTVRLIVGTLFALIGLFNLFAGLRSRSHYRNLRP